jgi:hypothetical protein
MSKKEPKAVLKRESTLGFLAAEYAESAAYTTELRRAIDSFKGKIPEDSPYRYLRMDVGEAILSFLRTTTQPQTIQQLIRELQSGACPLGAVKSAHEIVTKAVNALVRVGQVRWTDNSKTHVALTDKGKKTI